MVLPLSRSTDAVPFCALFAGEAFIALRHVTEKSGHNDSAVPHKMFQLQAIHRRFMKDCDGTHTCVFRRSGATQSVFRQGFAPLLLWTAEEVRNVIFWTSFVEWTVARTCSQAILSNLQLGTVCSRSLHGMARTDRNPLRRRRLHGMTQSSIGHTDGDDQDRTSVCGSDVVLLSCEEWRVDPSSLLGNRMAPTSTTNGSTAWHEFAVNPGTDAPTLKQTTAKTTFVAL